jgi:hypothetical protein
VPKRLQEILIAVGESPPNSRDQYVDEVAAFGREAILELIPWLLDPSYSSFAVQVIERAGELEVRSAAISALRSALALELSAGSRREIDAALNRLTSASPGDARDETKVTPSRGREPNVGLDSLVPGRIYSRRSDLHAQGLGGNWQKGISYPRTGHYVLLFSNPARANEFGYHDGPIGNDRFRYFGEWSGTGDMSLSRGNEAIVDRTPFLYLFVRDGPGQRYVGQFALDRWERERTTRDGTEYQAIVFLLVRVG